MPKKIKERTVASWKAPDKIPKPDYTEHIELITRGETYPQFEPRGLVEKYKIFLAVMIPGAPPPFAPLVVGETRNYIDIETWLETPYTHKAGLSSDFREWFFNLDGRVSFTLVLDGPPLFYMTPETLATLHEYEQLVWGKTELFDPDLSDPHTWNFSITNLEDRIVTGAVHTALVLHLGDEE